MTTYLPQWSPVIAREACCVCGEFPEHCNCSSPVRRADIPPPVRRVEVGTPIDHPPHYMAHPSGIECIDVVEGFGFCVGNAIKYLWRAGLKGSAIEDLKKAAWYVNREIQRQTQESGSSEHAHQSGITTHD